KRPGLMLSIRPATLNRWRALLSLIFRLAVDSGKMSANPVRTLKPLAEHNKRKRYLSDDEEARLRAVVAKHYPHRMPDLDVALYTGIRCGSQYALRWADIDFKARLLTIRHSKPGEAQHVALNDAALAA